LAKETADVAIVGAGIMGLSIAYHLARRSDLRIIVLEKADNVAEGSTGASCAVLRQRYSFPESIMVARDGLRTYRDWANFTGIAEPRARFHHTGVLWMMGETPEEVVQGHALMASLGIDVSILDSPAVKARFPALSTCDSPVDWTGETPHECTEGEGFLFEEEGGYFDPVSACQDLAEAIRRDGVDLRFRAKVTNVRVAGGRVEGVDLADGTSIDAPMLINASGPWARQLAKMAGLDPGWSLKPIRAQVVYREWPDEVPGPLPVVGDESGGIYMRPEAGDSQILFGSIREEDEQEEIFDPDSFNQNIDAEFRDRKIHALHHRIPALPYRGAITGVAGLYTVNTEDVYPIVGPTEIEGFIVCNGFSGHGFKEAPSIGSMLAQWVTGKTAEFDTEAPLDFFSINRKPHEVEDKVVLA